MGSGQLSKYVGMLHMNVPRSLSFEAEQGALLLIHSCTTGLRTAVAVPLMSSLFIVRNFLDIVHCPLPRGHFRPCGPRIGARVRLREMSAYGRLNM